jgi:hypothetical protein
MGGYYTLYLEMCTLLQSGVCLSCFVPRLQKAYAKVRLMLLPTRYCHSLHFLLNIDVW